MSIKQIEEVYTKSKVLFIAIADKIGTSAPIVWQMTVSPVLLLLITGQVHIQRLVHKSINNQNTIHYAREKKNIRKKRRNVPGL